MAAAIRAAAPSPCTGTGHSRTGRGKRRRMVVRMSCSTAPEGEVMTPTTAGSMGQVFLRDASNRPSAASRRRSASMRASSAPAPAYSSFSTTSWYLLRSPCVVSRPVAITSMPSSGFMPRRATALFQVTASMQPPPSFSA